MPAMNLNVTTPTDRQIVMTRTFDAPRRLVWEAMSKPELVRRWLLGPPGWTMTVCDDDLRVGGTFRWVWPVTATLSVRNWARAVDFYKTAFGARELYRVEGGGVAQLAVSGAEFWVAEESPDNNNFSPETLGGCSVRMLLIVEDPAAVCKQAV